MSRRLKKLIKEFVFEESNRERLTLGAGVRLDPATNRVLLVNDPIHGYSTAPDLFVKTWLTNPKRAKGWLIFQVDLLHKRNFHNVIVTDIRFRLSSDGANQLWWNGTTWAAASPGDWNTETQISAHLPAFPIASQSIQVIANLSTNDPSQTPELYRVKILYSSDLEYQAEYIARSLIPAMREEILPISVYPYKVKAGEVTANLNAIESTYDIQSIDCVYNNTQDPDQLTDIYASYDPTTKIVTWSLPPAPNDLIWIRFVYAPRIIMSTSQDYTELQKVPAILVESVDSSGESEINYPEFVIDKATNAGWQLAPGVQCDLDLRIRFTADKLSDLDSLSDQAKKFFKERLITARGQDEKLRLYTIQEYTQAFSETQSELHSGRLRARICNAVFYPDDAKPVYGIQRFLMNGVTISEA